MSQLFPWGGQSTGVSAWFKICMQVKKAKNDQESSEEQILWMYTIRVNPYYDENSTIVMQGD